MRRVVAKDATNGCGGDGGAATAQLESPSAGGAVGVAVDSAGNIYIGDWGNHRIRRVSGGVITTVAGNGTEGFSGDNGPATSARVSLPAGVAVDAGANLYLAGAGNGGSRRASDGQNST